MKSYRQFCTIAHALDAVGDRWVLLVVRELLAMGPSRYTDLKRGLPGIATNLLADRLRTMEADGLIERHEAPPPVDTTLFRLTDRGRGLQGVLRALTEWGLDGMTAGPGPEEAVQPHWPTLAGGLLLPGRLAPGAEVVIGIVSEDETLRLVLRQGAFEIRRGDVPAADITLTGAATLVGAVLSGELSPDEAAGTGLRIDGARELLDGLVGPPARTSA
jgi:DNA-binding HxlR family transcriptional regulator